MLDSVTFGFACAINSLCLSISKVTYALCRNGKPKDEMSWLGNTGIAHPVSLTNRWGTTIVSRGTLILIWSWLKPKVSVDWLLSEAAVDRGRGRPVERRWCRASWPWHLDRLGRDADAGVPRVEQAEAETVARREILHGAHAGGAVAGATRLFGRGPPRAIFRELNWMTNEGRAPSLVPLDCELLGGFR